MVADSHKSSPCAKPESTVQILGRLAHLIWRCPDPTGRMSPTRWVPSQLGLLIYRKPTSSQARAAPIGRVRRPGGQPNAACEQAPVAVTPSTRVAIIQPVHAPNAFMGLNKMAEICVAEQMFARFFVTT